MPDNMKVVYVFAMIVIVYMPLILLFAASVIQAITLRTGPSKRLDLSSTICVWISSYHGLLLTILFIAGVKISDYYAANATDEDVTVSWGVGWSAYICLLALLLDLASAITSTIYSGSEKNQRDDNIPLGSDYA